MDFAARLVRLREAAQLSQEALAAACGRTQGWLGNIESGSGFPRVPEIYKLAARLQVHPGAFFADMPAASQPAGLDPATVALAHRLLRDAYADRGREPYSVEADPEMLLIASQKLAVIGNDPAAIASLGRELGRRESGDGKRDERAGRADPQPGGKRAAG